MPSLLPPAVTCRCAQPIGVSNHGWTSKWITIVCQRCHLTIPAEEATSAAYRITQAQLAHDRENQ